MRTGEPLGPGQAGCDEGVCLVVAALFPSQRLQLPTDSSSIEYGYYKACIQKNGVYLVCIT